MCPDCAPTPALSEIPLHPNFTARSSPPRPLPRGNPFAAQNEFSRNVGSCARSAAAPAAASRRRWATRSGSPRTAETRPFCSSRSLASGARWRSVTGSPGSRRLETLLLLPLPPPAEAEPLVVGRMYRLRGCGWLRVDTGRKESKERAESAEAAWRESGCSCWRYFAGGRSGACAGGAVRGSIDRMGSVSCSRGGLRRAGASRS